jgi:hypothetical protein
MHTLTLEQLRATTDAGGIANVMLKARGGTFYVQVNTRSGGEAVLAKARSSEPRRFGNPAQALTVIRRLGLAVGSFDVKDWNPDDKTAMRTRPDRAAALKRTHEAAGHDRWFRAQVEQGLAEAEDPNTSWVPHDVVKDDIDRQREALKAHITDGDA